MLKQSGAEREVDTAKATLSAAAACCPADMAIGIRARSAEDARNRTSAVLLHRGKAKAAARCGSYPAGFSLRARYLLREGNPICMSTKIFGRVAVCMAIPGGAEPPYAVRGLETNPSHSMPCSLAGRPRTGGCRAHNPVMSSGRFLPNPPTLMNAGALPGQLPACRMSYISDTPEDINAIMNAAPSFRPGVDINNHCLRPADSPAVIMTSGPIHFTGMADSRDAVKRGGRRRAANPEVPDARHPDMLDFVRAIPKSNDVDIPVDPDTEFGEAAESGHGHPERSAAVLDATAESVYRSVRPGIVFFDSINRHIMPAKARGIPPRSADHCWSGETRILTRDGPVSFRELTGGPSKVKVMTREEDGTLSYRTMENPGMTKQGAEVVCLVVESKQTGECAALRCTPDHRVYAVSASGVERRAAADLTPGTSLASLYLDGSVWEQTVGVSASVSEIPEYTMQGTGHPTPGILPLSLAAKKNGQKKKRATAEGFVAADGSIPAVRSAKKPGRLSRFLGRNHAILAVIRIGKTDVYNGMVETTHNYFVECGEGHYVLSGNCGEQVSCPAESRNPDSVRLAECAGNGWIGTRPPASDDGICAVHSPQRRRPPA